MKRACWWAEVAAYAPEKLVFVDETSTSIRLTRAYARAKRGQRAVGRVPRNHGRATSLVAALGPGGMRVAHTQLGALDSQSFAAFVRHTLGPQLTAGEVVVLDNLSVHKVAAVREAIQEVGCTLLFLPPYSPDFAPIEAAFAKIKAALRKAGARTQETLESAITSAVASVTAQDARGFFTHCGYSLA